MIKIENTHVEGWEAAIRGMRNPMNSWDKCDSVAYIDGLRMGQNDLLLASKLAKAGNDHAKFLRMIVVSADITAPLYWWKEFDTYKVGTVANSCSTMHTIHKEPFTLDDFSHEHLNAISMEVLEFTIDMLNQARKLYQQCKEKDYWWQMIQLLPSSYNQRRTVMLNYAVLRNIYHSRKNHKLDEWQMFCEWAEWLPYSEELICS
jgi:hypothetical protein